MRVFRVMALAVFVAGLLRPVTTRAQTSAVTTRGSLSGTNLDWIALYGAIDPILNPTAAIPGTVGPLTVTVLGPGSESTLKQSTSWFGVFTPASPVLFSAGSGSLTLAFSSDIYAIGADVQSNRLGSFTGTIKAYDFNNVLLGSYSAGGSYVGNENGIAPFLGIQSNTGIRSVTFDVAGSTLTNPQTGRPDLSLGIDQAVIETRPRSNTTVPEPTTYLLTGSGLAGVLLVARRRSRLSA